VAVQCEQRFAAGLESAGLDAIVGLKLRDGSAGVLAPLAVGAVLPTSKPTWINASWNLTTLEPLSAAVSGRLLWKAVSRREPCAASLSQKLA
jgi:hypothetical protein